MKPQERAPQGGPTSGAPISKDPGWGATRGAYLIGARVSRGPTWGARSWGELTSAAQRAGPRNSSATPTAPSRRSFPRGNPAGALAERCPSRASMSADFSRSARNWRGRFVPWRSAQIRTGSFPAYGSYLGWLTAKLACLDPRAHWSGLPRSGGRAGSDVPWSRRARLSSRHLLFGPRRRRGSPAVGWVMEYAADHRYSRPH